MTKSDGTASLIEFVIWYAELFNAVGGLTGEGLVDFPGIDVSDVEATLLEGLGNGNSWADTHDLWRNSSDLVRKDSTKDWKAELVGVGSSCEENDCSSIGKLT